MARKLPPLNQLRAFEAAARLQSFKDAASELHVTDAAISHQIKSLEEYLGMRLFHRLTREVRLVQEARSFASQLSNSLDQIASSTAELRLAKTTGNLKVSVAPSYGNRVLLPRLPLFQKLEPGFKVEIDLNFSVIDLKTSDISVALRYGLGNWPEMENVLIQKDALSPVCTRDFAKKLDLPASADVIASLPLATSKLPRDDWAAWFNAAGFRHAAGLDYLKFDNRALALDFALAGNGVALADLRMVSQDLATGHLIRLHPLVIGGQRGMYIVSPKSNFPDDRVTVFANWLREEVAKIDPSSNL